ncbi:hypothetical protein [Bacillus sp. REN3]|uniref:hypothetical protein n=1 Tax=Bacillus sp. REN3 TaxID=2802440 RepID=UPI001AED55C7|nr:hypothetical protein [Bacillus sp. REN3]
MVQEKVLAFKKGIHWDVLFLYKRKNIPSGLCPLILLAVENALLLFLDPRVFQKFSGKLVNNPNIEGKNAFYSTRRND